MALFGKLFGKETCFVCGTEVGALKRKRLADGVMCKDCAKRLSPWFDDFGDATKADIQTQLDARERNRQALEQGVFHTTRVLGDWDVILFDDQVRSFSALKCPSEEGLFGARRQVTDMSDVIDLNPDVLTLSQVKGVEINITETHHEVKHTVNGEEVSYSPRRWRYEYDFHLDVTVDSPFIKKLRLKLNDGAVKIVTEGERQAPPKVALPNVGQVASDLLLGKDRSVRIGSEVWDDEMLALEAAQHPSHSYNVAEIPAYRYGFKCSSQNWSDVQRYGRYTAMIREASAALQQ